MVPRQLLNTLRLKFFNVGLSPNGFYIVAQSPFPVCGQPLPFPNGSHLSSDRPLLPCSLISYFSEPDYAINGNFLGIVPLLDNHGCTTYRYAPNSFLCSYHNLDRSLKSTYTRFNSNLFNDFSSYCNRYIVSKQGLPYYF